MGYKVHDFKPDWRCGKVFATLNEANAYANDIIKAGGPVCLVTESNSRVTHKYDLNKK